MCVCASLRPEAAVVSAGASRRGRGFDSSQSQLTVGLHEEEVLEEVRGVGGVDGLL